MEAGNNALTDAACTASPGHKILAQTLSEPGLQSANCGGAQRGQGGVAWGKEGCGKGGVSLLLVLATV